MPRAPFASRTLAVAALILAAPLAIGAGELTRCLEEKPLPRVARVRTPAGEIQWARVLESAGGMPSRVAVLANASDIASALENASQPPGAGEEELILLPASGDAQVCAPVELPQAAIDAEQRVVVAAGLNYAAHAEESGGGEVFVFPKPVEPTAPYGAVSAPAGVTLLDYEVELAFVLL